MKHIGFDVRLAFVRWLRDLGRVPPESDPELAQRADVGYGWLQKWKKRDDAPDSRSISSKLAATLQVDPDWLLDGTGEAPDTDLWRRWLQAYQSTARGAAPMAKPGREIKELPASAFVPVPRSTAAKKKRGAK